MIHCKPLPVKTFKIIYWQLSLTIFTVSTKHTLANTVNSLPEG